MPNVFNPETLFAYKNSKSIINKIKENLNALCKTERKVNLRLIEWPNKFTAEIKNVCRLELVQISGVQFSDSSSSPKQNDWQQKNLYTVLFTTIGNFNNSTEAFELYNKVCRLSVSGIE